MDNKKCLHFNKKIIAGSKNTTQRNTDLLFKCSDCGLVIVENILGCWDDDELKEAYNHDIY